MAYTSMEGAIILKGTRHGLLASVREDADWREVLRELSGVATQNAEFLKNAQLVLDFGWREITEDQFDSIIAIIKAQGLGCNGILSTSLSTRTIAESRGYRAIIGRLGLAQHQGRRLRRDQQIPAAAVAPAGTVAPAAAESATVANAAVAPEPASTVTGTTNSENLASPNVPTAAAPSMQVADTNPVPVISSSAPNVTVSQANAASLDLSEPTISSGLVIVPVTPRAETPVEDSIEAAASTGEESLEAVPPSQEVSVEVTSTFDSADPVVANLPAMFDSSEQEGQRPFSSSHEPGIHVPHYQDEEPTLYIRKTLRSGQRVVFAGNVVLLGDLNPGAQIEADGDVIVLGQLRGSVHAGCEGDEEATVIASSLRATQLRIADRFYKADTGSRFFKKTPPSGTLRARLDGDNVVVEAMPVR